MELIDKSTIVAEIEELKSVFVNERTDFEKGYHYSLNLFISFLDTLEVKEVDLKKEYKDFVEEDPVYNKSVNGIVGKAIAKHFFELGIKAQKGK